MPILSTIAVRAAMIHLLLGFASGAIMLTNKGFPLNPATWSLLPAHIDLLLFGWTTQLIMGVAYWILPRHPRGPKRGNYAVAVASFVLLNLGVVFAAISPWIPFSGITGLAGRSLELLGVATFAFNAWQRIEVARR